MQYVDYYKTLGVDRKSSQDEIKKAYRKLSKEYHPDRNKDPKAEDKFKEVNEAYEVLKDKDKRARYDALGSNFKSGQDFRPPPGGGFDFSNMGFGPDFARSGQGPQGAPFTGFSDFFEAIFGGGTEPGGPMRGTRPGTRRPPPRSGGARPGGSRDGTNTEADIHVSLADANRGCTKSITLSFVVTSPDGGRSNETKTYTVKIPPGTADESRIRLRGQGGKARGNGKDGDLLLKVHIDDHPRFDVDGRDLRAALPLAPWEAALGTKVDFDTLDGSVRLTIPPHTSSGKTLRLKGKGLHNPKGDDGDLHIEVQIALPPSLSDAERELFEKLAATSRFNPRQ